MAGKSDAQRHHGSLGRYDLNQADHGQQLIGPGWKHHTFAQDQEGIYTPHSRTTSGTWLTNHPTSKAQLVNLSQGYEGKVHQTLRRKTPSGVLINGYDGTQPDVTAKRRASTDLLLAKAGCGGEISACKNGVYDSPPRAPLRKNQHLARDFRHIDLTMGGCTSSTYHGGGRVVKPKFEQHDHVFSALDVHVPVPQCQLHSGVDQCCCPGDGMVNHHAAILQHAAIDMTCKHFTSDAGVDPEKVLAWASAIYSSFGSAIEEAKRNNSQERTISSSVNRYSRNVHIEGNRTHPPADRVKRTKSNMFDQGVASISDYRPKIETVDEYRLSREALVGQGSQLMPSNARYNVPPSMYPPLDFYDGIKPSYISWSPTKILAGRHMTCPLGPQVSLSATGPQSECQNLIKAATTAYEYLNWLCYEQKLKWINGMLLASCLAHSLGDFTSSVFWNTRVLDLEKGNTEAMSNLAAAFLASGQALEAEHYWRLAIDVWPNYYKAAEHFIGHLCARGQQHQALQVISYVESCRLSAKSQNANSMASPESSLQGADSPLTSPTSSQGRTPSQRRRSSSWAEAKFKTAHRTAQDSSLWRVSSRDLDTVGVMTLIHAKANILYSLHDQLGAARAFEEVVLAATVEYTRLQDLIDTVLAVASQTSNTTSEGLPLVLSSKQPLLLTPEDALHTARRCFPHNGDLPGLVGIENEKSKRAAVAIVSTSLLSLAKIFQDTLASIGGHLGGSRPPYAVRDILALYYLSLSLQPCPSTANNVGILLASIQREVLGTEAAPVENLMFPGITHGSGPWLALKYYQYGLGLDNRHAHLYTNLGSLLKDLGQLPLAIQMYEKAVICDPDFDIALANLANAFKDEGMTAKAIEFYKRAVARNPDFTEPICGLANALNSVCDWVGRGGIVVPDSSYDKWHVDVKGALVGARAQGSRGSGWMLRIVDIVESQLENGERWGTGVLTEPTITSLLDQICRHMHDADVRDVHRKIPRQLLTLWASQKDQGWKVTKLIERAIRRIGWQWYRDQYMVFKQRPVVAYSRPRLPLALTSPSAPTVLPFHTFTLPLTARHIRSISERHGLRVSFSVLQAPWLPEHVYAPPPPPSPHLNVGYVSSDFNNHPLAHLMQSVFGMHNQKRVKAFCYALTPSDQSMYRRKIEQETQVFRDVSSWPIERIVNQIVGDGIHILINLNGYTKGARNEIFAARPAPIQMSFMGFAGTLGAEWCDYLLADETAIPLRTRRPWRREVDFSDLLESESVSYVQDDSWMYAENIIYTPTTFFCCDHLQSFPSPTPKLSWQQEQTRRWQMRQHIFPTLPTSTIIFGNFNQLYKIDPTTLRTWLRILSRVPNSILWLLRFPKLGETNLRATAVAWAGPRVAERITFTDVAPKAVHIARACVIDLFLDTPECNAHTTCADCLWSGTPVLTLPRYEWKMASRMAAGILGGAVDRSVKEGEEAWKELVVGSEEVYEETAVRLAKGLVYVDGKGGRVEGRLMELRRLIWEGRERKGGLFDTRGWVTRIERAYEVAWERWVKGEGGDVILKEYLDRDERIVQ